MPKNDNRKKFNFFQTRIDFWKKTKLTSLVLPVLLFILENIGKRLETHEKVGLHISKKINAKFR